MKQKQKSSNSIKNQVEVTNQNQVQDILNFQETTFLPDIFDYQIVKNDSNVNFQLFVNPHSYAIMCQLANVSMSYDQYCKSKETEQIIKKHHPECKNLEYVIFTGIKNDQNKWIRRANSKTQNAYIKCFFLLSFFRSYLPDINLDLYTEDLCKTLVIDKEVLQKILWRLHMDDLVNTHTELHKDTVKQHLETKQFVKFEPYKYEITNTIGSSGYSLNSKNKSFSENKSFLESKSYLIDYNLSTNLYKLIDLYDGNPILDFNSTDTPPSIIIPRFKLSKPINKGDESIDEDDEEILEERDQLLKEDLHYEYLPFVPYMAPYEKLCLDLHYRDYFKIGKYDSLELWQQHHNRTGKITFCGRLWHPFHSLGREYRKHVSYKHSPLIEGMDVSSCIYTLLYKCLRIAPDIDSGELQTYYNIVRSGQFYEHVMHYIPDDFYDDWNLEGNKRAIVKERLQAYRNTKSEGQARHLYPEIDAYFENNFPSIKKYLFKVECITNRQGKKVKRLQSDICRIETYIISEICNELLTYNVTPFSLHDGIYLSKFDMEALGLQVGLTEIEDVQKWMVNLFWKTYEDIPDSKIRELIDWQIAI